MKTTHSEVCGFSRETRDVIFGWQNNLSAGFNDRLQYWFYLEWFSNLTTITVFLSLHITPLILLQKPTCCVVSFPWHVGLATDIKAILQTKPTMFCFLFCFFLLFFFFLTIETLWVTFASSQTQNDEENKMNQRRNQQGQH